MKDTKLKFEFYSFYDHTGIERHLERMAAKGWLLEEIGSFFWHYRRIEPKKLTFSVNFFPQASQYDPKPSDRQEEFYGLCAHTGWTLAASSAQMQIFYNERPDPLPIYTDPVLEVEAIHKSAKKGYFLSQALLAGVGVMNLVTFLFRLRSDPIRTLATPSSLFAAVCWPALLLILGIDLGSYFLWRHRALKAAEQGEFLPTRSHTMSQRVLLAIVLITFAWSTSTLSSGLALITVAFVAAMLAVILLISGIREALRNNQTPAGTNKAVTITLCVVLPILLTAAIPYFVINSAGSGRGTSPDELPLAMDDLPDLGAFDYGSGYADSHWLEESPLLARIEAHLFPWQREDLENSAPELYYTVTTVKVPALYGLCRDHLLYVNDTRDTGMLPVKYYAPIDPAPWGADEAYRFTMEDGDVVLYNYLLCYPGRIVYFSPDWEPTPGQMAVVAEKLGGA